MLKKPLLTEHLLKNVYFDTCVYHQPGINLLAQVIPVDNILFASEMIGAVQGIDPETGNEYDDTKRYIDNLAVSAEDKRKIFEMNARTVYGRLDAVQRAQVLQPLDAHQPLEPLGRREPAVAVLQQHLHHGHYKRTALTLM